MTCHYEPMYKPHDIKSHRSSEMLHVDCSSQTAAVCLLSLFDHMVWCHHQFQEQQWPIQFSLTLNSLQSPFWVDLSPSIWLWQHQNCQHLSLVQRTNASLTPAKLSMLQVKCCQRQLKCSYCWLRSLETLVAAWRLLTQSITRYRPLPRL